MTRKVRGVHQAESEEEASGPRRRHLSRLCYAAMPFVLAVPGSSHSCVEARMVRGFVGIIFIVCDVSKGQDLQPNPVKPPLS